MSGVTFCPLLIFLLNNKEVDMKAWLIVLAFVFVAPVWADTEKVHRVVIHVDESDPQRQNLVLNNASNINKYYQSKNEEVEIEIVAYGPGLTMFSKDNSPVKKRIGNFMQNYDNVSLRACLNTHKKLSKKHGGSYPLMAETSFVDSGVIHLITRQEEGWAYLRP